MQTNDSQDNNPNLLDAAVDKLERAVAEKVSAQETVKEKGRERRSVFYHEDGSPMLAYSVLGLSRLYAVAAPDDVKPGRVSVNPVPFDIEHLRFGGGAPTNGGAVTLDLGNKEKLTLDPGAGVILGKPDSGKSLFANTLAQRNPDLVRVIRFREPEADSLLSERAFVLHFEEALRQDRPVIFVDSLRTTFYTTSGATGKGGVNMGIFALLTAYDILARKCGKVVIFALNPMSTDDVAIDYYLEAARGSVSCTLYAAAPKLLRISSRSNKKRAWVDGRYTPLTNESAEPTTDSRRAEIAFEATMPADQLFSLADLYVPM